MDNFIKIKILIIILLFIIFLFFIILGDLLYSSYTPVASPDEICSVDALGTDGFNAQFESFFGENRVKSVARGFLSKVITNNEKNKDDIISVVFISDIVGESSTSTENEELSKMINYINESKDKKYSIFASKYDDNGVLIEITIKQEQKQKTY